MRGSVKLAFVIIRAGGVFAACCLLFQTIAPKNYHYYPVIYVKPPPLLMREVRTVFVSSGLCSSPTCDRAGTPGGPVRTDKIVSCSYVWDREDIFNYNINTTKYLPAKAKAFVRIIDSPSSSVV